MNGYEEQYAQAIANCGIPKIGQLRLPDASTFQPGKLSLGLECLDRDLWDFDRAWELIRQSGAKRVRIQSGWQKTEKRKGEYDFGWLDHIVDRLTDAGMDPFLCLCYGNRLYCGDAEKYPFIENGGVGHFPIRTPEEREGWTGYVREVTHRYAGKIRAFEIWNEPDISAFARVDMPWADAYLELVKMTAPVIREAIPDAIVVSCTAGIARSELLVDRGIARYVDVHSFHGYQFFPEAYPPEALRNFLLKLKEKAPTLKFWRGESGCPSYNDPKSGGALSEITATEPKQAKFLLRHLINDLYNDEIELSSYFHAYDFEHFTKKVRYHYGLIRHEDLTVKPSYGCFQTLAYLFGGAVRPDRETTLSCIAQKGDDMPTKEECASMKCYSFRRGDERIFAYDLPKEIDDCVVAKTVRLSLPRGILPERYVILDPLTKNLYPLCTADRFLSPLTDYPLLVVPRNTVSCPQTDGEPLCRDACADERQGDHE